MSLVTKCHSFFCPIDSVHPAPDASPAQNQSSPTTDSCCCDVISRVGTYVLSCCSPQPVIVAPPPNQNRLTPFVPLLPNKINSILNVHNVTELCRLMSSGNTDSDANKIEEGMTDIFVNNDGPSLGDFEEISELITVARPYNGFRIIDHLARLLAAPGALQDEEKLRLLTRIFTRFQHAHFQNAWKAARNGTDIMQPVDIGVNPTHLVTLLENLTEELKVTHFQSNDVSVVSQQLKAIIALLDAMAIQKVDQVDFTRHENAYKVIAKFKDNPNLQLAYLAKYGTQCFTVIHHNKSGAQEFRHRAFLLVKGLAKANISITEPWGVISIIEGIPEIKEALFFKDQQEKWFPLLLDLRGMTLGNSPDYLRKFNDGLKDHLFEIRPDINNVGFVMGFLDLLWDVLHSQEQEENTKLLALNLCSQIYDNNGETASDELPFVIDTGFRQQLRAFITQRVQMCATHPQASVREAAVNRLNRWGKSINVASILQPMSTTLFDRAVQESNPLLLTLQILRNALVDDQQLTKSRPYFIELDARVPGAIDMTPLDDQLIDFLRPENKNPVLAIDGSAGAGKSLGIKMFANRLLDTYTEDKFYPIYCYLPQLKDPIYAAVDESLENRIGTDTKGVKARDDFMKRKTVWIFDAYDELDLKKLDAKEVELFLNIYPKLGLNAKVIFLYRSGGLAPEIRPNDIFAPNTGELQRLVIDPFTHDKITKYVNQFCDYRKKYPPADPTMRLLWNKDEYTSNFTQLKGTIFWDIITNPFRLRIMTEILPIIAKAHGSSFNLSELFTGDQKSVIEQKMFTYFASICALRAARKLKNQIIAPAKFIDHQIQVAAKLRKNSLPNIIPQEMDDKTRLLFGELFLGNSPKSQISNQIFAKEYEEATVNGQKVWKFMHDEYLDFFNSLYYQNFTEKEERKMIEETITEKRFRALFGTD